MPGSPHAMPGRLIPWRVIPDLIGNLLMPGLLAPHSGFAPNLILPR